MLTARLYRQCPSKCRNGEQIIMGIMGSHDHPHLERLLTPGATATLAEGDTWHLEIPCAPAGRYCVAQLDDYHTRPGGVLPRARLPWQAPFTLALRARVSAEELPGTWGFGLWNDPFSFSLGLGGAARRFPALPNCLWFFYASPPNYLSFGDDLPAQGFLAATFRSPHIAPLLLALGGPALALGLTAPSARLLRRLLRAFIHQDAARISAAPLSAWHEYSLVWDRERAVFGIDGQAVFTTAVLPHGPLALVLWIDNQYAALPPGGRLASGSLALPQAAWLEIQALKVPGRRA